MTRPALSVAICTYNGARYLAEQLESVAAQSRPPDELVVCDDGSTDETVAIVRAFERQAPFPVRVFVNSRNLGSTRNFEEAIARCSGDIIVLADQDDVWRWDKLERLAGVLEESPCVGAVFSDAEVVDERLNPLGYRLWESVRFTPTEQARLKAGDAFRVLVRHNVVTGATMAFRSAHRSLILPIPPAWTHDGWIALIVAAVADLAMIPEPLVAYRQHAANQIGAVPRDKRTKGRKPAAVVAQRHAERVRLYALARERLVSPAASACVSPGVLKLLDGAITHYRAREAMLEQPSRWRRLPLAVREVLTLRYHRYARGLRSFRKDLGRPVLVSPAREESSARRRTAGKAS